MVTMAFPYALDAITWKTYMINGAWDVLQLVFVLVFWVETKGLSLEEIDMLFDGVKHSDVVDVCDAMRGKADPMVLNDIDITMEEPVAVVGKVDKES